MARAYGFVLYANLVLPQYVDLATIAPAKENRTALAAGGWLDPTLVLPSTTTISERNLGLNEPYYICINEQELAITNAAVASNVATVTVGDTTGVTTGNRVKVMNLPSPFAGLNGTHVITAITSTTISFALTAANISSATTTGTAYSGTDLALDGTDPPFRILGIESGPFSSNTDKEESPVWDDEAAGYKRSEPVSKAGTINFSGKTFYTDAGYQALRLAEEGNVSRSLQLKLARIGPAGYNETLFGYGSFDTFQETNDAGATIKWQSNFSFDGPSATIRHRAV